MDFCLPHLVFILNQYDGFVYIYVRLYFMHKQLFVKDKIDTFMYCFKKWSSLSDFFKGYAFTSAFFLKSIDR